MTYHWELLSFARVFLGDIAATKYQDDTILTVLRVATAVVQLLGYDKNHTSDPSGITPALTVKEQAIWGKAAAVLLNDPEAAKAALEAVSVRTLGTAYSTEAKAGFAAASASKDFAQLKAMIRMASNPLVGTPDDLDKDMART
jgi:hypothetical protein